MAAIYPSARKHGVADRDIHHALENAMAVDDDGDIRLYIGPSRSANLLEIVVIPTEEGKELVVHAMPMRRKYRRLLRGW